MRGTCHVGLKLIHAKVFSGYTTYIRYGDMSLSYRSVIHRGHASCLTVSQIRSEFDDLLFRHASKCGAAVFDNTRVAEL
ncbi:uncharacterized protein BJ212DRAFT_1369529 [Suillus subaureus]|uniref:Uncharacterized protein n=1 Tax=Suillus subaureus TaxID=48587 RepID=A0A9P7JB86_9AGAM|nr:uncharacterized protein BJ212DRAFT_1369529 [Suillus subaureus]KAG1812410.1 hypothetical protein BJ212DRAFT_1369529 [Suillus subaureus]